MKLILMTAFGLVLSAAAAPGRCEEADKNIFVTVQNSHQGDRYVAVIDEICVEEVFNGRIIANGERSVELCAKEFRGATVLIRNERSGAEERFRDVLGGASLPVP
ncbi:MAG: hypothetical protein U9Q81_15135 [Pseudomonadota bacterium]|nr:hypothetical protein [Pseudomonadota bacterium]